MKLAPKSTRKKWAPDPMTFLSGVLIVFAFPPWNLWPLAAVFLIPWLIALKKAPTYREAIRQGFWLSFFMSLGGFYWVAFVLQEFGGLNWPLSVLGLLDFCIFGQPQFFLFAPLLKKFQLEQALTKKWSPWKTCLLALVLAFAYT